MRKKSGKSRIIEHLSEAISKKMAQAVLKQTKQGLEKRLREEFDMDDFFFSDAEDAARADMEKSYGDKMVHSKLGDKEDTKSFLSSLSNASEEDVDQHASHLKSGNQTFNQRLVNFVSKLPEMSNMRESDPRGLLDIIGLAAFKYVSDHNAASPFIIGLQDWISELDHEYSPSEEDLDDVNMSVYSKLAQFGKIYDKEMERARLSEELSFLDDDDTDDDGSKKYTYNIDLDERGLFYADVRDENENTVYEIKVGYGENKDNDIFNDGYMSDKHDIEGLEEYLKSINKIEQDSEIRNAFAFGHRLEENDLEEEFSHIDDEQEHLSNSYTIAGPKEGDPYWYVVNQEGDYVDGGFSTENEAMTSLNTINSEANEPLEYGVDFKECKFSRIDSLLNEAIVLMNEYRSLGGYPAGAEGDENAPWNDRDTKPEKQSPPSKFEFIDSEKECFILSDSGVSFVFNAESLSTDDVEEIAINYVGVPNSPEMSDDGEYDTVHDTSQYKSYKDLPHSAIVDHINANYTFMELGKGIDDWESGNCDLVEIDQQLAKELKSDYPRISIPI